MADDAMLILPLPLPDPFAAADIRPAPLFARLPFALDWSVRFGARWVPRL